jgi:hypothetical protein
MKEKYKKKKKIPVVTSSLRAATATLWLLHALQLKLGGKLTHGKFAIDYCKNHKRKHGRRVLEMGCIIMHAGQLGT